MRCATASRGLDLLVALSLLPQFIFANRIITDTPEPLKPTITGKHTLAVREAGGHEGP